MESEMLLAGSEHILKQERKQIGNYLLPSRAAVSSTAHQVGDSEVSRFSIGTNVAAYGSFKSP